MRVLFFDLIYLLDLCMYLTQPDLSSQKTGGGRGTTVTAHLKFIHFLYKYVLYNI